MRNISESLAGRLAILPKQGISYRERNNIKCDRPFLPTETYLSQRGTEYHQIEDLWTLIHQGHVPGLIASGGDWETFYSSYVSTYIEPDVNDLTMLPDKEDIVRFMAALAARSGELLNYENIAKDSGITSMKVKQ